MNLVLFVVLAREREQHESDTNENIPNHENQRKKRKPIKSHYCD